MFDSSDEAKKGDVMGEREGERGFGELGLARQRGRLEQSGFVLGQGLESRGG